MIVEKIVKDYDSVGAIVEQWRPAKCAALEVELVELRGRELERAKLHFGRATHAIRLPIVLGLVAGMRGRIGDLVFEFGAVLDTAPTMEIFAVETSGAS